LGLGGWDGRGGIRFLEGGRGRVVEGRGSGVMGSDMADWRRKFPEGKEHCQVDRF